MIPDHDSFQISGCMGTEDAFVLERGHLQRGHLHTPTAAGLRPARPAAAQERRPTDFFDFFDFEKNSDFFF